MTYLLFHLIPLSNIFYNHYMEKSAPLVWLHQLNQLGCKS
ncbi:hypothetical protein ECP03018673_1255 [Escherichia coli P0301867.3]|nr:hypothetical protein ECP03018671_0409 [Escherichia coli P0301867.1]END06513.1 hypothetical protein ECP03018678_1316 [Escherichia coli P0301867.8]END96855.1 hypothetical protein ECP030186713_0402 [Escherichia coli P0301867.13]ENG98688.1 hypothetical protein ECP03018673_1255 [Escherichia coli P0301867.3]ENH05239.1 hypothetical protein ECP03018675_0401 [Escherichia coli P0301867.5]KEN60418.1 hypothetical protein AB81_0341 [Escherichia coli 6-537-08_S1_C3]